MSEPLHPTDALQDALDGRLDAEGRAALDAHLATCEECRRELDALAWAKSRVATLRQVGDAPEDLPARLQRALDEEDNRRRREVTTRTTSSLEAGRSRRWVGWVAAAAALVAAIWIGSRLGGDPPPVEAAGMFRAFIAGSLPLDVRTGDLAVLEARLNQAGLGFPARVFDFGMMDYGLTGGGVHRLAGQRSALFAYRGADSRALVCQMYSGTVRDLPPPSERRVNEGIEFLVYREADVTIVFWQEGPIVCVLVANGDSEAAIKLAFAKAVRA